MYIVARKCTKRPRGYKKLNCTNSSKQQQTECKDPASNFVSLIWLAFNKMPSVAFKPKTKAAFCNAINYLNERLKNKGDPS